jgi:hypothetical protein
VKRESLGALLKRHLPELANDGEEDIASALPQDPVELDKQRLEALIAQRICE